MIDLRRLDSNITIGDIKFTVQAIATRIFCGKHSKIRNMIEAMNTSRYLGGSSLEKQNSVY